MIPEVFVKKLGLDYFVSKAPLRFCGDEIILMFPFSTLQQVTLPRVRERNSETRCMSQQWTVASSLASAVPHNYRSNLRSHWGDRRSF